MSADERERQRRLREDNGLRSDPGWLDWVTEHGVDGGTLMMLPVPLADSEILELRDRSQRAQDAFAAFEAAGLASAAGVWFDSRAGGVARLLLAHPTAEDLTIAEDIVSEHGGALEFVEHPTRQLDAVAALVGEEVARRSPFGRAVTSCGEDVWTNAVRVVLRGDLHPEFPERIHAALEAGTLIIDQPTEFAEWEPTSATGTGHVAAPSAEQPRPCWPGEGDPDPAAQLARCVGYVADRCVGGPLDAAERLAKDIGLAVRVIYPGSSKTLDLRGNRVTLYVNAEHIVRGADAG